MAKMMERQGGDSGPNAGSGRRALSGTPGRVTSSRCSPTLFYQSGVYDRLNVGGLGVLEVICRRIAVLVEAHSQPSRPNWAAARYLEGPPTSDEFILPGLRSYAMRRAKEEIDIQNAQQRSYTRSSGENEDEKGDQGRQRF